MTKISEKGIEKAARALFTGSQVDYADIDDATNVARAAISAYLDVVATEPPAAPEPPVSAPGHTDLMVLPESIDAFLKANHLPPEPLVSDGWRDIASAPTGNNLKVWVWGPKLKEPELREADGEWWRSGISIFTHWFPHRLPAAPKGKENE